ncbi:MAG: biopolymer transporter ExbD, partial [Planctomycetota bacterium]
FFMCSIHFKSLEGKLYSYLPRDKGMANTEVTYPILDEIRIKLIYAENKLPLLTRIKIGEKEFADWDSLEKHIRSIALSLVTEKGDIIPVKIDPDDRIPAQSVVSVLNICKKAGVQKTEFAAKTSPGKK